MTSQTIQEQGFETLAKAVDDASATVAGLDDAPRKAAEELRAAVEAAHKAALVTIVRRLRADEAGRAVLYELVDDPLIRLLFSLHGIIRPDPVTAARAALDAVRPALKSHGGDVELVRIDEGTAYVRLSGACDGCSMSSATMRGTVEQALIPSVPSVTAVEVLPNEPALTVIPLSSVRRRDETAAELEEAGWLRTVAAADVPDGEVIQLRLTGPGGVPERLIVVRVGDALAAYEDRCAHEAMPLGDAMVDATAGTLTCPWHGYCYDALTGDCLSAPGAALSQRPLRVVGEDVWIRSGA